MLSTWCNSSEDGRAGCRHHPSAEGLLLQQIWLPLQRRVGLAVGGSLWSRLAALRRKTVLNNLGSHPLLQGKALHGRGSKILPVLLRLLQER